jgi:hypothetical protein
MAIPPPAPTPTPAPSSGAAAPTTDPNVFGGLKINGPRRIGVGWRVSYSATDHGGRPVSEVSWHAMADNIRVEGDGTVVGLRPGRATVMATAHGMRAFFDFEVVVDDGAPATPGGPPALTTPRPDVVVVPSEQPTPTPPPASVPPADDRTTDWAEPTPTPWFVPEESDSGTGDERFSEGDRDRGGGFEDLGTEIAPGSDTSPSQSEHSGTPTIPIGPAGAAVAGAGDLARPPDAPPSDGGFEDLGTEVVPTDAEPEPLQPRVTGEAAEGSTGAEAARPAADDGPAESSEPAEGLTFLGETAGPAAAPITDGPMVLLPPPGEGSPGSGGAPPSGGRPPGGPRPPNPGDDWPPFVPSRASVNGAGQPAAYHIFATCSRLGWAGALATYSVGPADAAIADHLLIAGEHAMWANRTSYPPLPAWPDWQARRGLWGDWAARLARSRDAVFRGQMAHFLSTGHETLAQDLDVQMVGGAISRTPTCEAEYCRLGFLMAWGQQALAIAEEADRNGNTQISEAATVDGLKRLRLARGRVSGYGRIASATGSCADFTPLGGLLDGAIGGGGSTAARTAWKTALAAVMALGPGQPPPSDGSLLGGWVLADGRLVTVTQQGDSLVGMADNRALFRVRPQGGGSYSGQGLITTRSGDSEQSRWYDGLTIGVDGDTATGTIGQFGFTMTRAGESPMDAPLSASADSTPPARQCPVVHFNGEIQGDWAWDYANVVTFKPVGDEWLGAFTTLSRKRAEAGYRRGEPFFRVRRTGELSYRGSALYRTAGGTSKQVDWDLLVAGSSMLLGENIVVPRGREKHHTCFGSYPRWIGCRQRDLENLDCTVDCSFEVELFNPIDGRSALRQAGYPLIVAGPLGFQDVRSWILDHHGTRVCIDPAVSVSPAGSATGPRPSDLQMMGVEVSEDGGGRTP